MPTIFDLLYREYCRARLAEMRKQLLIRAVDDATLDADWDGGDPRRPDDRESDRGDGAATQEPRTAT